MDKIVIEQKKNKALFIGMAIICFLMGISFVASAYSASGNFSRFPSSSFLPIFLVVVLLPCNNKYPNKKLRDLYSYKKALLQSLVICLPLIILGIISVQLLFLSIGILLFVLAFYFVHAFVKNKTSFNIEIDEDALTLNYTKKKNRIGWGEIEDIILEDKLSASEVVLILKNDSPTVKSHTLFEKFTFFCYEKPIYSIPCNNLNRQASDLYILIKVAFEKGTVHKFSVK